MSAFKSLSESELTTLIKKARLLGFQVLRHWEVAQESIEAVLERPLVSKILSDEQLISLVRLLKAVRSLQYVSKHAEELFTATGGKVPGYKVQSGKELSEDNTLYPDRHILLRHIDGDKYQVKDFADFPKYQAQHLLSEYRVNEALLQDFVYMVSTYLGCADDWVKKTGGKMFIDEQTVRLTRQGEHVDGKKE